MALRPSERVAMRFVAAISGGLSVILGRGNGGIIYGEIKERLAVGVVSGRFSQVQTPYTFSACWHFRWEIPQFPHSDSHRFR
jgi:hypothetical protein